MSAAINPANILPVDTVINFAAKYLGGSERVESKQKYNILTGTSVLATLATAVAVLAGSVFLAAAALLVRFAAEQEIASKFAYVGAGAMSAARVGDVKVDKDWQEFAVRILGLNVLRNYIA